MTRAKWAGKGGRGPARPAVRGRARVHVPGRMNKTEEAYAWWLTAERAAGRVARFDFEPEALRIGPGCVYTPDFRVVLPDGTIEFHDVKGARQRKAKTALPGELEAYVEEDALVKIKAAAEQHPYVFALVWYGLRGWERREFEATGGQG